MKRAIVFTGAGIVVGAVSAMALTWWSVKRLVTVPWRERKEVAWYMEQGRAR